MKRYNGLKYAYNNNFGGGGVLKAFLCASFLGFSTLSASAADMTPTLGEDSAYTVTKVIEAGESTILTYEINKDTYELTPHYYGIEFKKDFGAVGVVGAIPTYLKWQESDGSYRVIDGSAEYNDIIFWSDPSISYERVTDNQNGLNITHGFTGLHSNTHGGAISNTNGSQIGDIHGDFLNNSTITTQNNGDGGAIYNNDSITGDIKGHFVGNFSQGNGGAIYNYNNSEIGDIEGDFIRNTSAGTAGVIYNGTNSIIGDIKGSFIENSAAFGGGVIRNTESQIGNIDGLFIKNYSGQRGGAICNENNSTIMDINADFIENSADKYGGAIHNTNSEMGSITGDFIGNTTGFGGGAIYNDRTIADISGNFIGNSSEERGGAIFNTGDITGSIINSSFINNYINYNGTPDLDGPQGAAIYTNKDLNIIADNDSSIFSGNYTETADGVRDDNAIYVDGATLSFDLKNGGSIVMKDNIDGTNDYEVNITGDDKEMTTFYMHNDIRNSILSAGNTTLHTINDEVHTYNVNSFTLTGDTNFVADVDLAGEDMDKIESDSYGTHMGNLHVIGMNLLNDAPAGRDTTEIYFAQPGLMNNVVNGTGELPDQYQTAYTPIYKYNVDYEVREDDGGYFLFTRGGGADTGNPSDNFNPAVLNTPVANLAAGQATINESFKYVFEHADAFPQLPAAERMAQIKNDYYALSTDYNTNLDGLGGLNGGLAPEFHNDGAWVRPYVTFESMNLKNGPDVDAITYGTLIGFDSDFEDFGHGWTGVTTGYVGYNGSQLNYSGNDTSMNGGLLGVTQTFYKGDFWTAITASAGASVGETSTMYGSEDFTSLLAGVGSKTGYNFEFKEGKYILQPIMFLSYTFVNTFDYTNAAGVKIESDPLHTIQLNPSVRFIANLKNGWQPYASVGMVWNLLNQTDTTANGVSLPDMHVKPYVEYGIGVQKRWADKFTAFFQTMIRNGGRNGVALTGGFRWNLGKDPDKTVNNVNKVKKVIKTLDTKVAGK